MTTYVNPGTTVELVTHLVPPRMLSGIEDPVARQVIDHLVKAVSQLQNLLVTARSTEQDNMPSHGQVSEMFNGVYVRLTSKGFADLRHDVKHGLGRTPQGCIFTRQRTANNECVLEGDSAFGGIPAADDTTVSFLIGDPAGSAVVALLW